MNDFIETLGLQAAVDEISTSSRNLEVVYTEAIRQDNVRIIEFLNSAIYNYFSQIEIPDSPTMYDYLILSLRKKDVIITFNWDPLIVQAYKRWRHLGLALPELIFLHGNVDVGYDSQKHAVGFLSDGRYPGYEMKPTPLLYPVSEKNYSANEFISHQWEMAKKFISDSYFLTIYGYSAPVSDVEANALLLSAWKKNALRWIAHIDLIDLRSRQDVLNSWATFILDDRYCNVSSSIDSNVLMRHPRRSCEALAWANLQQDPWSERPMPKFENLKDMSEWMRPLIEEENSGKLKKS